MRAGRATMAEVATAPATTAAQDKKKVKTKVKHRKRNENRKKRKAEPETQQVHPLQGLLQPVQVSEKTGQSKETPCWSLTFHAALRVQVKKEFDVSDVKVEYVSAPTEAPAGMENVMKHFMSVEELLAPRGTSEKEAAAAATALAMANAADKVAIMAESLKKKWSKQEEEAAAEKHMTKQERKVEKRLRTAMLKQMVDHPEVVDM